MSESKNVSDIVLKYIEVSYDEFLLYVSNGVITVSFIMAYKF